MFGSLLILVVLATLAAAFQYETMYQKGVIVSSLPSPPEKYIIPNGQCTAILTHKENYDCFGEVVALQVKVFDTGFNQATPKVQFKRCLNEVHIERQSLLCLGEAQVELKFLCSLLEDKASRSVNVDSDFEVIDSEEEHYSETCKNTGVLRPGSVTVDSDFVAIDSENPQSGTRKNGRVLRRIPNTK